jgi:hypothetical protein
MDSIKMVGKVLSHVFPFASFKICFKHMVGEKNDQMGDYQDLYPVTYFFLLW